MDFVNRHRRCQAVALAALLHPGPIAPMIIEIPDDGSGARRYLLIEGERIALIDLITVIVRDNMVLVGDAGTDAGKEAAPDAGAALGMKAILALGPAVEIADDGDLFRCRRPHGEMRAGDAIARAGMRAQFAIEPTMTALVEQVQILFAQQRFSLQDQCFRQIQFFDHEALSVQWLNWNP